MRSNADVVKYVTKDENFLSNMTKDEILGIIQSREKKTAILGESMLKEGLTY